MMMTKKKLRSIKEMDGQLGYLQIADAVEGMIINGALQGNDRLPSTQELIEILGVSRLTVQRSLTRLSERGLVRRMPRRGTFVANGVSSSTIGLISGGDPLSSSSPFYPLLITAFHKLSNTFPVSFNNYIFMEAGDSARNFMTLEEDIKAGRLKSLIIISSTLEMEQWLENHCTISRVHTCGTNVQARVFEGVKRLCETGYENIRVLSLYNDSKQYALDREKEQMAMLEAHRACGCPGQMPELVTCGQSEADGYRYVKETFAADKTNRPDALLINHDMLTRGVLMASLELGLKIPGNLGLITHMNKGADILSPVPLDGLLVDPEEIARKTLEFITVSSSSLKAGKVLCPQSIPATFVKGSST
jgi:DNA-binding LacI/PurR family transcriptional regulator